MFKAKKPLYRSLTRVRLFFLTRPSYQRMLPVSSMASISIKRTSLRIVKERRNDCYVERSNPAARSNFAVDLRTCYDVAVVSRIKRFYGPYVCNFDK